MRCRLAARWACATTHAAAPGPPSARNGAGTARGLFFVSASYRGRSLLTAATELVARVKEAMGAGRPPHLVTLFATPHQEYGAGLADLPQYVRALMVDEGLPPPLIIGGVLRGVAGGGFGPADCEPGVALLAAHLPGVRLLTFHTTQGSLPALSGGSWADVMLASRGGAAQSPAARDAAAATMAVGTARSGATATAAVTAASVAGIGRAGGGAAGSSSSPPPPPPTLPRATSAAALLLSSPHFLAVEELLQRFGQVAPSMKVVGGVTAPGAWGESESEWGALWLNDRTFAQGAVGCVLLGDFKFDTVVSPGFRGAGPLMRVTAARGQLVMELDGQPVQQPLRRAISAALHSGESASTLKMGVGDATSSNTSSSSGIAGRPGSSSTTADANSHSQRPPHTAPHLSHPAAPTSASHTHHHHHHPQLPAQQSTQPSSLAPPGLQPSPASGHPPAAAPQLGSPPPPLGSPPPPLGSPPQLVTRGWGFQQGPQQRPLLGLNTTAPVAPGTLLQVHMQDYPAAESHMRQRLRAYSEELPPAVAAAQGAVGVLALSCSGLPFFGDEEVASCLPGAALAGGTLEGEICSTVEGQPSRLHTFTSCFALIRAAGVDDGAPVHDACSGTAAAGGGSAHEPAGG
ncbi:hypothetical protein Agub_g1821 [Astrephomene gubernaculifera]|uniref:FIST domain-containing protein n=1 Tax=Astrephomene gubernaculifera TaxID=47775 RepID=A0AAD3DIS6_9CHLO|nr:hypothetical protein Agub_g1821 [Astrephomene gubernaculifera]